MRVFATCFFPLVFESKVNGVPVCACLSQWCLQTLESPPDPPPIGRHTDSRWYPMMTLQVKSLDTSFGQTESRRWTRIVGFKGQLAEPHMRPNVLPVCLVWLTPHTLQEKTGKGGWSWTSAHSLLGFHNQPDWHYYWTHLQRTHTHTVTLHDGNCEGSPVFPGFHSHLLPGWELCQILFFFPSFFFPSPVHCSDVVQKHLCIGFLFYMWKKFK